MKLLNHSSGSSPTDALNEEEILRTILDTAFHLKLIEAYALNVIPQTGPLQGAPYTMTRSRRTVPQRTFKECLFLTNHFDFGSAGQRNIEWRAVDGFYICLTPLARTYDINIGCICFIAQRKAPASEIHFLLDFIEMLVSSRKRALALMYQPRFLSIGFDSDETLDYRIGNIVHNAISPNETLIVRHDDDAHLFIVTYSSHGSCFSIPDKLTPLAYCRETKQSAIIQDIDDGDNIERLYGRGLFNIEYLRKRNLKSCAMFPVVRKGTCYSYVVCLFKRKNAISAVEKSIIRDVTGVMADYYELRAQSSILSSKISENQKIAALVRHALLIADIMHDNVDDLITARGQLDMIQPRNPSEVIALQHAKRSLKTLIQSAAQFKHYFAGQLLRNKMTSTYLLKNPLHVESLSLYDIFTDIFKKYAPELAKEKIAIKNLCHRNFMLVAMEGNIRRAIDNTIKNSIYHLRQKSSGKRLIIVNAKIEKRAVSPGEPPDSVEIIVYDNGPGVPPEHLARIKEPFVSLRGGMGLGLAITTAACEAHGGRLDVQSEWGEFFRARMIIPRTSR